MGKIKGKRITALLIVFILCMGAFFTFAFADGEDKKTAHLEEFDLSLGLSLGFSGTEISTLNQLEKLSMDVAAGNTMAGETFILTQNLSVQDRKEWTPIGTEEFPFAGTFDGNGLSISALGSENRPALFGHVKNASLKNLTVRSKKQNPQATHNELYISGENSTIVNCPISFMEGGNPGNIGLLGASGIESRSGFTRSLADYTIRNAEQLQALANTVNGAISGQPANSLLGKTVYFDNVDMSSVNNWYGIGTKEHPFEGEVLGGTVTNLTIRRSADDYVGLFGHTSSAKITDLKLINVDVVGGRYTGALVGKGHNTKITQSMSSGRVQGTIYVGGLVGQFTDEFNPSRFEPDAPDRDSHVAVLMEKEMISWNYSTADVVGNVFVGGLIGEVFAHGEGVQAVFSIVPANPDYNDDLNKQNLPVEGEIQNCFTTGNVSGVLQVGGLVGGLKAQVENGLYDQWSSLTPTPTPVTWSGNWQWYQQASIRECATSGNVTGIGKVGGMVGTGINIDENDKDPAKDSWLSSTTSIALYSSYTTSTVSALADTGGLIGSQLQAVSVYNTGHMTSPAQTRLTASGDLTPIGSWIGRVGGYTTGADRIVTEYNSMYPMDNYLNANTSPGVPHSYKEDTDTNVPTQLGPGWDSSYFPLKNVEFFEDGAGSMTSNYWDTTKNRFNAPTVTYSTNDALHQSRPLSGHYPQLESYRTAAGPRGEAFKNFSDLTTEVKYRNVSQRAYYNTSGAQDIYKDDISIPNIGGMLWTLNDVPEGTKFEIVDSTLKEGVNKLWTQNNKLYSTAPLVSQEDTILSATVPSIPGYGVKYNISFMDEAVRPVYTSLPESFYKTAAEANTGGKTFSNKVKVVALEFPEIVEMTTNSLAGGGSSSVKLEEYGSPDFSGTPTVKNDVVTARLVNNTTLLIDIQQGVLSYGKSYRLVFSNTSSNTLRDMGTANTQGGNYWEQSYYFKTPENLAPTLSFDPNYSLAKDPESVTGTTTQTLVMKVDDGRYISLHDGIVATDPNAFVLPTNANINFTGTSNMSGKEGYPVLNLALPSSNFYLIPGEYKATYTVPDPEFPLNPSLVSAPIVRTYRINSQVKVHHGGKEYQNIQPHLTQEYLAPLIAENSGKSFSEIVGIALEKMYLETTGADALTAFRYMYDGSIQNKKITFNTSNIVEDDKINGIETVLSFTAEDGETYNFPITIDSNVLDKELIVDYYSYVTTRDRYIKNSTYSKSRARQYYNARVVRRSNGKVLDDRIDYDFSQVDPYAFDVPQEVTLRLKDGDKLLGIDPGQLPEVKLLITIEQDLRWKHPEERWTDDHEDSEGFWQGKTETVRKIEKNAMLPVDLSFFNGARATRDFFIVLQKQENVEVNFTLTNGYKLKFNSNNLNYEATDQGLTEFNLNVEAMNSYHVERDIKGAAVQQFYTSGDHLLPGPVTITIPKNHNMPNQGLKLYTINKDTGDYVLEQELKLAQVQEDDFIITLNEFKGEYIITGEEIAGQPTSLAYD